MRNLCLDGLSGEEKLGNHDPIKFSQNLTLTPKLDNTADYLANKSCSNIKLPNNGMFLYYTNQSMLKLKL